MAIRANIQLQNKGNTTTVSQNKQSVTVQQSAKNQVTVVEKGSFASAAAASDKHKSININVNDWSSNGTEWEATFNPLQLIFLIFASSYITKIICK